ncbi:flavin reductase family protein [Streptomyces sp. 8L]|uniref:flavin reductase family protein n=1 Tax=Streptomyces sp. 8L TaxID=2877242 RepID=UPI001CD2F2BA|nr:flavin reductase family protein [Streptomyces sp. 8L]MCA1220839.1 flavin reductase family protein [Streptomyces sp. 8L]
MTVFAQHSPTAGDHSVRDAESRDRSARDSARETTACRHPAGHAAVRGHAAPEAGSEQGGAILRRTLRRHASGVTVITVPGPAGFTATSFTSVSLDPALVSFCLGLTASTAEAVRGADRFAVHVLGAADAALASRFARSGVDRFAGASWAPDDGGLPLLDGVPAWLTARVTLRQVVGDHLLVVGEVESGGGHHGGAALVHHDGAFAGLAPLAPEFGG